MESAVHSEVYYATKALNEFANSFHQKSGEGVGMWDNGEQSVKLDGAEFTDLGPECAESGLLRKLTQLK